jgi:hypothetical protein
MPHVISQIVARIPKALNSCFDAETRCRDFNIIVIVAAAISKGYMPKENWIARCSTIVGTDPESGESGRI